MTIIDEARKGYGMKFNAQPALVSSAPGRVNLIGEHTDYNEGLVLPCAINFGTSVAAGLRSDGEIRIHAMDYDEDDHFSLNQKLEPCSVKPWRNYIRGVIQALHDRDYEIQGCNLCITGNVPQGAGLSSSASLEIATVKALVDLNGLSLSIREMAEIGQSAEHNFAGCNCGIMDQLISAAGIAGHAIAIDCKDLSLTPVRIPESLSLIIIDSGIQRGLVDSEYNTRRTQCEEVARSMGASSLRGISLADLDAAASTLDPTAYRRARHVLTENERVLETISALQAGDIGKVSGLMFESHESMRLDFEITTPAIDYLVQTVSDVTGVRGGARMTGGGFGGCVISLVETDLTRAVISAVDLAYPAKTGHQHTVYEVTISEGAQSSVNNSAR